MGKYVGGGGHPEGLLSTVRTDRWWIEPMWTGMGFLCFVIYSTWAAFQGEHYFSGSYLSPFYSPALFVDTAALGHAPLEHAWFGAWPEWLRSIWPPGLPTSPAWLILAGPMAFRATCYYYRKFYYRAYFMSPPGCAVNPRPEKNYRGETALFIFQNLHRYTWYIAVGYIIVLYYDAYLAFWHDGELGMGVGTLVLLINPTLLSLYTFGCHSCRHLTAGRLDCFSCEGTPTTSHSIWSKVTKLNENHMLWAWVSMIWVGLTDVYVRLCSMGVITDLNTWD